MEWNGNMLMICVSGGQRKHRYMCVSSANAMIRYQKMDEVMGWVG